MRLITFLMLLFAGQSAIFAQPMNVLFIAADDLNCSLGCYGNSEVASPNIDRLASEGMLFKKAYCQQAVCNPSRASVMTGLRPDTIKVWDLRTDFRTARPEAITLPQCFKQQGYFTRGIGKIFHNMGDLNDEPSWSVPSMHHAGRHSDEYVLGGTNVIPGKKYTAFERGDVSDAAYRDGKIVELACQQLNEIGDTPFFLAVGFWRPHLPFLAPEKYWIHNDNQLTLAKSFDKPLDVPEIALHDSRELKGYGPAPANLSLEETRTLWHGYYASIQYLDTQVGKLLTTLKETGLAERTIVVFWSDHGFHLGQHSLWCKTSCFELDARVPLIISAPGINSGVSDSLVELVDVYPTLAELCGLQMQSLEGISLVPILKDPTATVKNFAITQHPRPAYYKGHPEIMGYSIRTPDLRYTEWKETQTGTITARELYDHRTDPDETRNISSNELYSAQIQNLHQMLSRYAVPPLPPK